MNPFNPKDPDGTPNHAPSSGADTRQEPVLGPLNRLLADLDRLRSGKLPSSRGEGTFSTWQDEENFYLEANLPAFGNLNVDLNVYDGKVFIRMEQ
jgi:hypothetical protein